MERRANEATTETVSALVSACALVGGVDRTISQSGDEDRPQGIEARDCAADRRNEGTRMIYKLLFDDQKMQPACVLIQAAYGIPYDGFVIAMFDD